MSLTEHLKLSKREVAVVIQDCVEALRDGWMDTEGLFRVAGSAAKVKFLKASLCPNLSPTFTCFTACTCMWCIVSLESLCVSSA